MSNEYLKQHDISFAGLSDEKIMSATGMKLITESGKEKLDFNNITTILGYNNKEFINRVKSVLEIGILTPVKGYCDNQTELYKKLNKLTNDDFEKIFLSSSGSEAIEWAVRIARNYTKKDEIIAFSDSLHGRTYLAASLSGIGKRKKDLGIKAPAIMHANYPNCSRCHLNLKKDSCNFACIDEIDTMIENESNGNVAAIIIEPFTGSTGMVFPPDGYLKKLFKWAKSRGIVFILDEIQTAFGKTGNMFMYQKEAINPDMIVIGKGFGNGMHIAGILAKSEVLKNLDGSVLFGGTGSSPLNVEGANAIIDIIESEKLLDHVKNLEMHIKVEFERLLNTYDVIDNYRGSGVAYGIEFVDNKIDRKKNNSLVSSIVNKAKAYGLIIGRSKNVLFFRPPLCVTKNETDIFISTLEKILNSSDVQLI